MKSILIVGLTFLSLILYSQNNMNEQLNKLFLDLDLTSNPQAMANKSSLKFEHVVRKGISWGNTGGNINNFVASFSKHPLIQSRIKEGQISIIQKEEDVQFSNFSVNERISFNDEKDMISEYKQLTESFEKLGYRVKSSTIQNENFEIKSENTEILMEDNSNKSKLTIGYYTPSKDERNKEYFLALVFTNY